MVLAFETCLQKRFGPLSKRGSWALRTGEGQLATRTRQVSEVDEQETEVEAHRLGVRKAAGEGAEPREGQRRPVLVVQPDGHRRQGLGVVWGGLRGREK